MAFGTKATTGATYKSNDTGDNAGKDVFLPTASGPKGEALEYNFRLFEDEEEVVYKEWAGEVSIGNGRKSFRSCIVAYDNPFDAKSREIKEEIDAMDISAEMKKELYKERGVKWTSSKFAINVFARSANKVQVLKGGWNKMQTDPNTGDVIVSGRSMYAGLLDVRGKARVKDPSNPKRAIVLEMHEHDITLTCKGQGQLGKNYSFSANTFDTDPLTLEQLEMPRYDLETWVTGNGVWPNAALERLVAGKSYYDLVNEFNIALYPSLRETVEVPVSAGDIVEDDENLFEN